MVRSGLGRPGENRRRPDSAQNLSLVPAAAESPPEPAIRTPLRVAYMAGPGNVHAALECLAAGRRDTTNSHVGYSELMVRACQSVGVTELLALTTHPSGGTERSLPMDLDGLVVRTERIPNHFAGRRGLGYHLASFQHARYVRGLLERFQPHVLVVSDDPPRAAALPLMRPAGCKLVRVHHCAITPVRRPRRLTERVLLRIDSLIAQGSIDAVMSASRAVSNQVRELFPGVPIAEFLPHFDRDLHWRIQPLPAFEGELRCVYVGRVEWAKGVFDLHQAIRWARRQGARVSIDLCGDGSAMSELRQSVAAFGSEEYFRLHGWCDRQRMQELVARAHVGVVPTRSDFGEGFNQSAIELLLSGRPIVTSHAIPAASYVQGAASIVQHDDPSAYAEELAHLASRQGFGQVERMYHACERVVASFLAGETSYQAAMEHVLRALAHEKFVEPRQVSCPDFDLATMPSF